MAELQRKAMAEQKPYLLYFYTQWSPPCEEMELNTFASKELQSYLNRHFLVFKIDAESNSRSGVDLVKVHDIMLYPTILIMSPEGQLIGRYSGFKGPRALQADLMMAMEQPTNQPIIFDLNTDKSEESPRDDVWEEVIEPQPSTLVIETAPANPTPRPKARPMVAYGVQTGSFQNLDNARRLEQKLENQLGTQVILREYTRNGRLFYRVILGPFTNEKDAEIMQSRYERINPTSNGSMLIDWEER
ncbi:MAG: SPOR domain-containing protein [Bacteroidota bacterium]